MTVFITENGLKNCDFSAFSSENKAENLSFNSIPCLKFIKHRSIHLSKTLLHNAAGSNTITNLLRSLSNFTQQDLFKTIARATEVINSGYAGTTLNKVTSVCVSSLIALVAPFIEYSANSCSAAPGPLK